MNKNRNKFKRSVKHSSIPFPSKLKNAILNGGTVTYHFETERIRFTKKFPNGEFYLVKSVLKKPLNPEIMFNIRGERRSPSEIREILESYVYDLGAKYFTLE